MFRVFISAPGDLAADRDTCRAAIAAVNEKDAMPSKILLVSVGLPNDDQILAHRAAVAENVRAASYYVQIFEDDWGPRNLFRKMFLLGQDCRDDVAMPMRDIVVCLKDAPRETDPEILEFRRELQAACNVQLITYRNVSELKDKLHPIFRSWVAVLSAETAAVAGAAG